MNLFFVESRANGKTAIAIVRAPAATKVPQILALAMLESNLGPEHFTAGSSTVVALNAEGREGVVVGFEIKP